MLIWTAIWLLMWILGLATIPMFILSIINKKASVAKNLIFLSIYLPLFVLLMIWLTDILNVEISFSIVIYYMAGIAFLLLDVISLIINAVKMKKLDKTAKSKPVFIGVLVLAIAPVVILSAVCLRQVIILRTSELVVKIDSRGNGGIGDGAELVYAYDGNDIRRIDLGSSYALDKYLPGDMKKSGDRTHAGDYIVEMGNRDELKIDNTAKGQVDMLTIEHFNNDIEAVYYK